MNKRQNIIGIIHFVGIGGIGMSGIAEIMHNMGYIVQGSDITDNNNTQRMRFLGMKVYQAHDITNILGVSYVVISSAIKENNPEIIAAHKSAIPVIKRSEMLAELMRFKSSIAIAGSHGKTTTTSLTACLFEAAGLDPTVINGGIINNRATNAYLGKGEYLIAEADESDATFIKIPSQIGVITNIDPEHMDYYGNFENVINAFSQFITNLPFYGFAVVCIDHPIVRNLIQTIHTKRIITYGIDSDDAHIRAYNIILDICSSTFDIKIQLPNLKGATIIEQITIPTPGKHNVLNALAAISIGIELNFGIKLIQDGFKQFKGVKRRFTKIGKYNDAEIIDDYAHHPVEIKATLNTARTIANQKNGRVFAIFQPHRYSRLQILFDDFIQCFDSADHVYIADVFAAGESTIQDIDSQILVSKILEYNAKTATVSKEVRYITHLDKIANIISSNAVQGDIFVIMGAGNITQWANNLPQQLELIE